MKLIFLAETPASGFTYQPFTSSPFFPFFLTSGCADFGNLPTIPVSQVVCQQLGTYVYVNRRMWLQILM